MTSVLPGHVSSSPRPEPSTGGGRPRLKFMTCGSVDDGKSTLIGRLLHESGAIFEDHLAEALKAGGSEELDFSFLVDGLKAEREQGITIDVAYRYFMTRQRAFLIADAPGHEQYTRNQAAAASQTDLAIVVVSAVDGMRSQTRRHLAIASMFGVRSILIAVNKMDLVDWRQDVFDGLAREVAAFATKLGQEVLGAVPVSAKFGGNVTQRAAQTAWYAGPTLISHLETFEPQGTADGNFMLPIQHVARLSNGGRLLLGEVASGRISVGDKLRTLEGLDVTASQLWRSGVKAESAGPGNPVALLLSPERDLSRGMVLTRGGEIPPRARQVRVRMVVLDGAGFQRGRSYAIDIGTGSSVASLVRTEGTVDLESLTLSASDAELRANDIVVGRLSLMWPLACCPFSESRTLGAFIMTDRTSRRTVAAGIVLSVELNESDLSWQQTEVGPADRARSLGQTPVVVWLTGLSGSGKSTIAEHLDRRLFGLNRHAAVLDGDKLRDGLASDLGFSVSDRIENMRRVSHVAALMADAGLIVIVSLISPFAAERARARETIGTERFVEVFVDAPLDICAERDPKGHYKRAAAGTLAQFTGIASSYEPPQHPDVHLHTDVMTVEHCIDLVMERIARA